MKIKWAGTEMNAISDLKDVFYIGWYEWDTADYGFTIRILGLEWNWLIDLKKNKQKLKAL
jgi:hypothetical protein